MSRDFACMHDSMYLHMHELQPPPPHFSYPRYEMRPIDPDPSAASLYKLTTGASGVSSATSATSVTSVTSDLVSSSLLRVPPLSPVSSSSSTRLRALDSRKRKGYGSSRSAYDDDFSDDMRLSRSSSRATLPEKRQNHSEIEKRRRDKMNTYITQLSGLVPMCGAMARKLDKLTVLRMAVQHVRSVRGALSSCPLAAWPQPACLSQPELNALVLRAARDSFLLVVDCDRGKLLYVSRSVQTVLHYQQAELLGQSLFDLLHPKDVAKVKEQLSSSDLSPRERLIDAKTMLPVRAEPAASSRLSPGARRSFFCRMRAPATPEPPVKDDPEPASTSRPKHSDRKYSVVQCTGYLKYLTSAELYGSEREGEAGEDADGAVSCLVALGRALPDLPLPPLPPPLPPPAKRAELEFFSRHATDGKFLFVDQRVTVALGYLPQELVGASLYELVGARSLAGVAHAHRRALLARAPLTTPPYAMRRKDGTDARLMTHFKPFWNPWTKDVECLVANSTLLPEEGQEPEATDPPFGGVFKQGVAPVSEPDVEMQQLIDSQVESHKIGSAIAEEALRRPSPDFSPDLPADLLQDVFTQQFLDENGASQTSANVIDRILGGEDSIVEAEPPLEADTETTLEPEAEVEPEAEMETEAEAEAEAPLPLALDGNGEATMAVIMSLLEADAGLGGHVNFTSLPWPMP